MRRGGNRGRSQRPKGKKPGGKAQRALRRVQVSSQKPPQPTARQAGPTTEEKIQRAQQKRAQRAVRQRNGRLVEIMTEEWPKTAGGRFKLSLNMWLIDNMRISPRTYEQLTMMEAAFMGMRKQFNILVSSRYFSDPNVRCLILRRVTPNALQRLNEVSRYPIAVSEVKDRSLRRQYKELTKGKHPLAEEVIPREAPGGNCYINVHGTRIPLPGRFRRMRLLVLTDLGRSCLSLVEPYFFELDKLIRNLAEYTDNAVRTRDVAHTLMERYMQAVSEKK